MGLITLQIRAIIRSCLPRLCSCTKIQWEIISILTLLLRVSSMETLCLWWGWAWWAWVAWVECPWTGWTPWPCTTECRECHRACKDTHWCLLNNIGSKLYVSTLTKQITECRNRINRCKTRNKKSHMKGLDLLRGNQHRIKNKNHRWLCSNKKW